MKAVDLGGLLKHRSTSTELHSKDSQRIRGYSSRPQYTISKQNLIFDGSDGENSEQQSKAQKEKTSNIDPYTQFLNQASELVLNLPSHRNPSEPHLPYTNQIRSNSRGQGSREKYVDMRLIGNINKRMYTKPDSGQWCP